MSGFTFLRAKALRDDERRAQLVGANGLLHYQEIRRRCPDALVTLIVTELQAYRHELVDRCLIISHCWEEPNVPDPEGKQLEEIVKHVRKHERIEFVWCDYPCLPQELPQESRTEAERVMFKNLLPHVNLLYLGASVLLLMDVWYMSRFWTQYEAWLSTQVASAEHGLCGALHNERRCTIVPINTAIFEMVAPRVNQLSKMVAPRVDQQSPEARTQLITFLSDPEVHVTNDSDKTEQLAKVRGMNVRVMEILEDPRYPVTTFPRLRVDHSADASSGGLVAMAARLLPIAMINVTDYASDLLVLREFYLSGFLLGAYLGTGMVVFSVVAAWILLITIGDQKRSHGRVVPVYVLMLTAFGVPLNLHVLVFGLFLLQLGKTLSSTELAAASSQSRRRKLGLIIGAPDSFDQGSMLERIIRASHVQNCFNFFKCLEAGLESAPMSILTVASLASQGGGQLRGLYVSSFALSIASITYGVWSLSTMAHSFELRDREFDVRRSLPTRRTQLFIAVCIHTLFTTLAFGFFCATAETVAVVYTFTALTAASTVACALAFWWLLFPVFVVTGEEHSLWIRFIANPGSSIRNRFLVGCIVQPLTTVLLCLPVAIAFLTIDIAVALAVMNKFDWILLLNFEWRWKQQWARDASVFVYPVVRRVFLLGMAIASLVAQYDRKRAILLGMLQFLDLFASPRMFLLHGHIHSDPLLWVAWVGARCVEKVRRRTDRIRLMRRSETRPREETPAFSEPPAVDLRDRLVYDMLQTISEMPNDSLARSLTMIEKRTIHAGELRGRADFPQWVSLQEFCRERIKWVTPGPLSVPYRQHLERILSTYIPTPANACFLYDQMEANAPHDRSPSPRVDRSLHIVSLSQALRDDALGSPQEKCDYLVVRADGSGDVRGRRRLLRDFLCLHDFVGCASVSLSMLALFLLPFGFAIASIAPAVPFWIPSAVAAAVLVAVLAWTALGAFGVQHVPPPWSLYRATLFLQTSQLPDGRHERIDLLYRAVHNTRGKMIAFVGRDFFSDLRCVVSLALWCKRYKSNLAPRLLLLSEDWPSVWNPCKGFELDRWRDEMRDLLRNFRCLPGEGGGSPPWCADPYERALLLSVIREEWVSEAEFEAFVRKHVYDLVEESATRYRTQLRGTVVQSFNLLFGD